MKSGSPKPRVRKEPKPPAGRLPLYLVADDCRLLRELCEAADIEGGAEGFADALIGELVRQSLSSTARIPSGVSEHILDGWILKDPEAASRAMQAVVDRWNAKEGRAA